MKRMLWLIVVCMIVGLGAHAEGGFISAEAAVIAAKADLQAYGGLTGGELDSFTFVSDGVEDRSDKGMGMVRCVHAVYDVHPGLPDLRIAHFISATDGKVVARFDSPFRDGRDFAGYYRTIGACSAFLYAQEALEETDGPFRTWPEAKQQAFYARYGNYNDFLSKQYLPLPTDVQSWEARHATDRLMADQYGYAEGELAQFEVETVYQYMESRPDIWFVSYARKGEDVPLITFAVHYEDGVILKVGEV